ncbi:MAG: ATP phosphoribosyltransferase regulatory subunit [Gammaproteobacteria bacterium]
MQKFSRMPAHLSDLPPPAAGQLETARRAALDWLFARGYELHLPPLAEYAEALAAGDESLHLDIFKMTDTLSGQTLGIRADHTPQTARFDAAAGGAPRRLCYCGPALRARPPQAWKGREIMQIGAEIFNLPAPAADWEIIHAAAGALRAAGIADIAVDIGHAGIIRRLLETFPPEERETLAQHAARRDSAALRDAAGGNSALAKLLDDGNDLARARKYAGGESETDIDGLAHILRMLHLEGIDAAPNFGETGGYGYHTGVVFSIYGKDFAAARGGRYERPGFRPAVGFSMDLREILEHLSPAPPRPEPVACPPSEDESWFAAVAVLQKQNRAVRFAAEENPPPPVLEKTSEGGWKVRET